MCFSAHTYLNVLSEISGICVQYFAVSLILLYTIGRHTTCWWSSTKKIDTTPISDVSRIHVKFWHYSRDPKIGVTSFFLFSNTNRWYAALLHNLIHDWLRNMGAELPVFRILHANPCLHKTPPQNGMCFVSGRFWVRNTKYWEFSAHIPMRFVPRAPLWVEGRVCWCQIK